MSRLGARWASARDKLQELRELGAGGLAFRIRWELELRSGLMPALEGMPRPLPAAASLALDALPFAAARAIVPALVKRVAPSSLAALATTAEDVTGGHILCFGRWTGDYGDPIDWHRNPVTRARWNPQLHWTRAMRDERRAGDVKLAWEVGRFPHAYHLARAAAFVPQRREEFATALAAQIDRFVAENPYAFGVHWGSGQEIVFRLVAWLFTLRALGGDGPMRSALPAIRRHLHEGALHVERHIAYAEKAVYNNHLLSEAFGLLLAGQLLPLAPEAARWRARGLTTLTRQADRQFYEDGGYIQQSHNYERVALQVYLWAISLLRSSGEPVPPEWLAALGRAVDFLHAQQNPADGRLPNYGANDGALPSPLTTCDYSDFRPTLQAASIAARGERLYEPGPWDEETAWLLGPAALDVPLRPRARRSISFGPTGFHVLRTSDEGSFSVLRCGSVRDRFSQIDMLHLDVWWRGENVLVDPGSYLYNGADAWHSHFMRTGSHNTVVVDDRDQMLHHRRFKTLYWTRARLLRFEENARWALTEGEHTGYARHPGACVHRRAVLQVGADLRVVVDRVEGRGSHAARLQWLGGPYPHRFDPGKARLTLVTPRGDFAVQVLDASGAPVPVDVVAGQESPPRGWLSRYYGEKVSVPSLVCERVGPCPLEAVTLLSGGPAEVNVDPYGWTVRAAGVQVRFRISEGRFSEIDVRSPA